MKSITLICIEKERKKIKTADDIDGWAQIGDGESLDVSLSFFVLDSPTHNVAYNYYFSFVVVFLSRFFLSFAIRNV
jgi:hypothetical protein